MSLFFPPSLSQTTSEHQYWLFEKTHILLQFFKSKSVK